MLKVYTHPDQYNPLIPGVDLHILPFDIESENFVFTHNVDECDVIPVMCDYPTPEVKQILGETCDKLIVRLFHTHVSEEDGSFYADVYNNWKGYANNFCIASADYRAEQSLPGVAFCYDFLWNCQKAYYYDYDEIVSGRIRMWSHLATKDMYQLPEISLMSTDQQHLKKFLSPNRTDLSCLHISNRLIYRYLFYNYLCDSDAYWSDWSANPPKPLAAQQDGVMGPNGERFAGWWPVNNFYYDNSIISVFVETLVSQTNLRTLTEKTLEPLHKGNFVLPFGYSGLVADIKEYGFVLPDWIDYSYDSVSDETMRFALYVQEFLRLRNQYTLSQLLELRNRDIDVLHHNRNLFSSRPYDSLYEKLIKFVGTQKL